MNRTLRCLMMLLLAASNTSAQHDFFQYGFQTGPTRVNLYGNPFIEAFLKPEWRISGGPAIYYPFARKWAIRSNLFLESKGSGGIIPLFDEEGKPMGLYNIKTQMRYLTVPLLFDFHFGRRLRGNLTGGPFLGLLIGHRTVYTEPVSGEEIISKGTSNFIPWDGGVILGSGVRFGVNRRITLSLDGRLNIGMTNVISRPILSSLTIYTLSTQILFGIYYTPGYNAGKVRNVN